MKLGTLIRDTRKMMGFQQEDLAQKVGTNQGYISRIENYIEPDFTTACLILEALDLDIKEAWEKMRPKKEETNIK